MNTSNNLELFQQWSKRPVLQYRKTTTTKQCVVYTRVSSKEQYDTNLSLDWQRKAIEEYANRNDFQVVSYFGGTFESAKTDGRKEFQSMMEFIRKNKEKITHILVYLLDRFSRTGDGAMRLAKELREKYGVTIIAVTQPIDTSNPGGVFQQNLQFLFSQYDNELRRQRAMAGIRENLERGIWCKRPPMGYTIVKEGKERKIIVNAIGKKLRKAFEWKISGMKNDEILSKLQAMGLKMYKQKLSAVFSNPFYCGILADKMLNGKLVEGQQEKLISHETFLLVNNIRAAAKGKYGVTHKKENEEYPLKVFMQCDGCGRGYTGYVVKKKNKRNEREYHFHYYKCRSRGCCCNRQTQLVNDQFKAYLEGYMIKPEMIAPILYQMNYAFDQYFDNQEKNLQTLEDRIGEVDKKIANLEDEHYIEKKIPEATFHRLLTKLEEEKKQIREEMVPANFDSSNLKKYFEVGLKLSTKLAPTWHSSPVAIKEKIQKAIFPKGIVYNFKKGTFLTNEVNPVFACIADLAAITADPKNKQGSISAALSRLVGWTGFEPATPCTPYKCATGLRHHPNDD